MAPSDPLDPAALMGLRLSELLARTAAAPRAAFLERCRHALMLRLPGESRLRADPTFSLRTPRSARRKTAAERLDALSAQLRAGADTLGSGALFLPSPTGEPIHLGADPLRCELVIGSAGIDAQHAQLNWTGTRWTLTDLEAPGGTWVEERRMPAGIPFPLVGAQLLRLGDDFRALFLAPQQLHDLARNAPAARSTPPQIPANGRVFRAFAPAAIRFDLERFQAAFPHPFLLETAKGGRPASASRLFAVVEHADGLVLGRGKDCAIRIDDKTVSARHARLELHPRVGWRIQDLESANGTWINGNRLPAGVTVPLRPGSALGLGKFRTMVLEARRVHQLARQLRRAMPPAEAAMTHWKVSVPPALIDQDETAVSLFSDSRPPMAGTVTTISQVQELLIWLERRKRTGTLRFTPGDGKPTEGALVFAQGRVMSARIGPHRGRRALERVCLSPGGRYAFSSEVEPEEADLNLSIYQFVCTELGTAQLLQVGLEAMQARGKAA